MEAPIPQFACMRKNERIARVALGYQSPKALLLGKKRDGGNVTVAHIVTGFFQMRLTYNGLPMSVAVLSYIQKLGLPLGIPGMPVCPRRDNKI